MSSIDLRRCLVRVLDVDELLGVARLLVPTWEANTSFQVEIGNLPQIVRARLMPGFRFLAHMNAAANEPEEIGLCKFELAPIPAEID